MRVHRMIDNYRWFGHYDADIDPLKNDHVKNYFVRHEDLDEASLLIKDNEL